MRNILLAMSGLLVLGGLTACNTMRGIGEDMSALGRYISSSSGTASGHSAPPPSSF